MVKEQSSQKAAYIHLAASVFAALSLLTLVLLLSHIAVRAEPPSPPTVATSSGAAVVTIPTPTLPSRLYLLAPAFALPKAAKAVTLTVQYGQLADTPLLAYRATVTDLWRRIPLQVDVEMEQLVIANAPSGEYALVKVSSAADSLPGNAVVVDDLDAGFVRSTSANWNEGSSPPGAFYSEHAYWTRNTHDTVDDWGTWTPPSSLDGAHEVQIFVPANYADTSNAVYKVQHDGQEDWQPVDQSTKWAEWVSLGIFTFTVGTESHVYLSDVTYEPPYSYMIAFDAVAFVPQISRVYLPLMVGNYPLPPSMKQWTGMHLGNHEGDDWTLEMLQPIDGDNGGVWPRAVVVQSKQVYNVWRAPEAPCEVAGAGVRGDRDIVHGYMKRAAQAGVWVVIRIAPSPGNFEDWDDPLRQNHQLRSDMVPAGGDYCGGKFDLFRAIDDVAAEMDAIHARNQINGWTEFGFEPANEPNTEWYSFATEPQIDEAEAWRDMNDYFGLLYNYVQSNFPDVRVFTPPMAQTAYAEGVNIEDRDYPLCEPMLVAETGGERFWPGYDYMWDTYAVKNDGYSWHNYYWQGQEAWAECPDGQHISYHFPTWLQGELDFSSKPRLVTEVDLASPWQMNGGNPLTDKDAASGNTAATSLRQFVQTEERADVVIVWLLDNDEADREEYDWHEAYSDDGMARSWFDAWWTADEE